MHKKIMAVIIAAAMMFSMTACDFKLGGKDNDIDTVESDTTETASDDTPDVAGNSDDSTTEAATESDSTTEAKVEEDSNTFDADKDAEEFSISYDDLDDWQKAFYDKLGEVQGETYQPIDEQDVMVPSTGYFIYDIDDDGTPELFIRYGTCEADYFIKMYKADGTTAEDVWTTYCGHTSFYSMPEKGMISYWGHMGYMSMNKMWFTGTEMESENICDQELEPGQGADEYTPVKDVVPGAEHLSEVRTDVYLPIIEYVKTPSTSMGLSDEEVEKRVDDVMNNNGDVYGVTGDGYSDTVGNVSFSTYLTKGNASKFYDYEVIGRDFHDLNCDGQVECILKLNSKDVGDNGIIVLSIQNDTVYAYAVSYVNNNITYNNDGSFTENADYVLTHRLCFYKDQAYFTYNN